MRKLGDKLKQNPVKLEEGFLKKIGNITRKKGNGLNKTIKDINFKGAKTFS